MQGEIEYSIVEENENGKDKMERGNGCLPGLKRECWEGLFNTLWVVDI